jgi:two-component system nitrate/nitrite response regulator NarL
VLVDVGLPRRPTAELVPELRRLVPQTAAIVLSPYDSAPLAYEFVRRGAAGYLLKPDIGIRLTHAIERALGQDVPAERAIVESDMQMTAREREVLALLATGRRNKDVAQALGISSKTVETHRARIMSKLDLHSMSALVRYAIRHHLIEA